METKNIKDLCETCSHYWFDSPLTLDNRVPHYKIADKEIGFNTMNEVVPYPCVNCPFNAYKKK